MPKVYKNVRLAYLDCDVAEDLVDALDVEHVQTLVLLHPEGSNRPIEKKVGIKPEQLTSIVEAENSFYRSWFEVEKKKAFQDIDAYIKTYPFYIFVKGTKEEPKCKFSRRLKESLAAAGYEYRTFNILEDERIR